SPPAPLPPREREGLRRQAPFHGDPLRPQDRRAAEEGSRVRQADQQLRPSVSMSLAPFSTAGAQTRARLAPVRRKTRRLAQAEAGRLVPCTRSRTGKLLAGRPLARRSAVSAT